MAKYTFDAVPAYRGTQAFAFISYAHEDTGLVAPLLTRLYQAGINLWYDEGITAGAKWRDELAVAIEESSAVLFLLTKSSAQSQYCRSEVDFALDSQTPILTLQFEELDMPPGLRLGLADRQIVPVHTLSVNEALEKTLDWLHGVIPGSEGSSETGANAFAVDLPQSVLRRYALDRALSASRMVFRARDIQRKRWVTIQRLIPENATRAANYLSFCRDTPHRNLIHVLELQVGTEHPYVVSEYVDCTALATLLASSEFARRAQLVRQAAMDLLEALASLHEAGVYHGDVQGDRIVLAQSGRFILLHPQSLPVSPSPERDLQQLGDLLVEITADSSGNSTLPELSNDLAATVEAIRAGSETAAGIAARLRASPDLGSSFAKPDSVFIGRQHELERLSGLYENLGHGACQVIAVSGASGIGKSALIQHFIEQIPVDTLTFSGACHPGDTESFNAFDELAYDLESFLRQQPLLEQLLPRNARLLDRLFPVFKSLLPADDSNDRWQQTDLDRVRRVAFSAFTELLGRISERWKLVIWLDDLQWADEESWALLGTLLETLDPPDMLLLMSFREEQGAEAKISQINPETVSIKSLRVSELPAEDMTELANALNLNGRLKADVASLVDHAGGSPFTLETLIRGAANNNGVAPQLDTASRLEGLSYLQRSLLDMVAVAEAPLNLPGLGSLVGEDPSLTVNELEELGLLQLVVVNGQQAVQVAHGRIREAALGKMSSVARRQSHAKLAALLDEENSTDQLALYRHHQGAGQYVEAYDCLLNAARAAAQEQLAFDTAVSLYEQALRTSDGRSASVYPELANTLVLAGQPVNAAERHLVAAAMTADHRATMEHTANAAFQFLIGGHFDEGVRLFVEVLKYHHVTYPKQQRQTQLWIRRCIKFLAVRGLTFDEREEGDIPRPLLDKLDALDAIARNLLVIDSLRGVLFAQLSLLHALRVGEPRRLFRALNFACSTPTIDASGKANADLARRLLKGELLDAEQRGDDEFVGRAAIDDAQVALHAGRWTDTVKFAGRGLTLLGGRNQYGWDCNMASMLAMRALEEMGDFNELLIRADTMVRAAEERGDFYGLVTGKLNLATVRLAHDRVDDAWDLINEVESMWARFEFHLQHFYIYRVQVFCDLYTGDIAAARSRRQVFAPKLQASGLRAVQTIKNDYALLNGRLALGIAAVSGEPVEFGSDMEVLEASERLDLKAHAELLRAGVAQLENRAADAEMSLESAAKLFEQAEMRLAAACAHAQLGRIRGDEAGIHFLSTANAKLSAQGIKQPDLWLQLQVPGFLEV